MKNICIYLISAITTLSLVSCGYKQNKPDEQATPKLLNNTATNLEDAINGEAAATAKYAAFAKKAVKEGLPQMEAMFNATSKAESIHLKNHLKALADMGIKDYTLVVEKFAVKTMAENLQGAIKGEDYEFKTMYPKYITVAENDYQAEALKSFKYAYGAEVNHAEMYSEALANIKEPKLLAKKYYVCPICGNVYSRKTPKVCELCKTASDKFIIFSTH
jgi:rubrerythrin